jgi:hypothetical protein
VSAVKKATFLASCGEADCVMDRLAPNSNLADPNAEVTQQLLDDVYPKTPDTEPILSCTPLTRYVLVLSAASMGW